MTAHSQTAGAQNRETRCVQGGRAALRSLPEMSTALSAAFPDLPVSRLRLINVGFGSIVVETAQGLILRIARTGAAAKGHAVEAATIPVLAAMLPVAVPVPVCFCAPTPGLPFGAIGHRRLPGRPCQQGTATATTASDMGAFLASLHRTDPGRFPSMPKPRQVWQNWLDLREQAEPVLRRLLSAGENRRVTNWWERFLADQRMQRYSPGVRHGDFWYGNLLTGPGGTVTAVLDWEAVAVADPAQDLALARYLGMSLAAKVLDAYRAHGGRWNEQVEYRIERHWELRELTGIPLAAAAGDEEEIGACLAKVRAGPILS